MVVSYSSVMLLLLVLLLLDNVPRETKPEEDFHI